jgi:hypothetical protein
VQESRERVNTQAEEVAGLTECGRRWLWGSCGTEKARSDALHQRRQNGLQEDGAAHTKGSTRVQNTHERTAGTRKVPMWEGACHSSQQPAERKRITIQDLLTPNIAISLLRHRNILKHMNSVKLCKKG